MTEPRFVRRSGLAVKFRDGPYVSFSYGFKETQVNEKEFVEEVEFWCRQHFGDGEDHRWYTNYKEFYFVRIDDAFEFRLRWC